MDIIEDLLWNVCKAAKTDTAKSPESMKDICLIKKK
jgi:hypothetical protein